MKINVLLFANLKEKTGKSKLELEIKPNSTLAELKQTLVEQYPLLKPVIKNVVNSINMTFADDEDVIPAGAEVAFFPPVSGGSEFLTVAKITMESLDVNRLITLITRPTTGAVCSFTGIVRGETEGGSFPETSWLEYEAYTPMAEAKLEQIALEMRSKWPDIEGIVLLQQVGRINPGQASVVVACSAAHRNTGVFEAAKYGIDRIKEIVPVWKKEVSPQGDEWVEGKYHPTKGD
jgi:MoaE-MoaD fusion protein